MSGAVGDITRGTTNPNRLRRVDRWVLHQVCSTIRKSQDPLVVDLGYGALPVTTKEMFDRLLKHVRPDAQVVGIEIDPDRVEEAKPIEQLGLSFKYGGFEIPTGDRKPIMIRAFNVLRQYDESEVLEAWQTMTNRLAPNGYLVEGTCDEIGRRSVWVSLRAGQSEPETITFSTHIGSLDKPSDLAPRLPKVLIHRNVPGEKIYEFLQAFDRAWLSQSGLIPFGSRQRFVAAVEQLATQYPILDNKVRWRLGEVTVPWHVVMQTDQPQNVQLTAPTCD
ncbi:MAG: hypothetical protein RLZZ571_570 [Actinomycetota bacterium]|jgi:trans-aconitate methyltransferase